MTMDFIVALPRMRKGFDSIWVIVDRLTKYAHFIPLVSTYKVVDLTKVYIRDIVRLCRVPSPIVSDRDSNFSSHLWKKI